MHVSHLIRLEDCMFIFTQHKLVRQAKVRLTFYHLPSSKKLYVEKILDHQHFPILFITKYINMENSFKLDFSPILHSICIAACSTIVPNYLLLLLLPDWFIFNLWQANQITYLNRMLICFNHYLFKKNNTSLVST